MRRFIGTFVVLGLIGGAVWIGLTLDSGHTNHELSIACGLGLCPDEAVIQPQILVEKCYRPNQCELIPYESYVFLEMVDLDTSKEPRCGPGDCGAATDAFQSGWEPGRWRIVAPRIRRLPHLLPPQPIDITLKAGATHEIELVYRDPSNGWPKGPFAHNCLPETAHGEGDFDGDGNLDRVDFYPRYASEGGFVAWVLRQRYGDQRRVSIPIDAECPEAIGAADMDQDGDDELFFDTGKGMTAALVDLMVHERGKLRQVTYRPKDTSLYVGTNMTERSDLRCFPTEGSPVFEIVTVDQQRKRVTSTTFSLRGHVVVETGTFPIRGDATGRLKCFGLRWRGY